MYKPTRVSGSLVSLGLALLKEACWYKNKAHVLYSCQSADLKIYHKATKSPCNGQRNPSLESDKTKGTQQGSRAEPKSHRTVLPTTYHSLRSFLQERPEAFGSVFESSSPIALICTCQEHCNHRCVHSHLPALQCQNPAASPALSWGLWPYPLLGVTSRIRGSSCQLWVATCRGTHCSSPTARTQPASAQEYHKNRLLGPPGGRAMSHSQEKFSHLFQRDLHGLWAHSRGERVCPWQVAETIPRCQSGDQKYSNKLHLPPKSWRCAQT